MRCTQFDEIETNSFDGVEGGYDAPTVVGEDLANDQAEVDENDLGNENEEEERDVVGEIAVTDEWNAGEFEVNINRCSECAHHFQYSRHSEDEYI